MTKQEEERPDDSSVYTHVLLLDGALFTVIGIRDSRASTDHTAPLVRAVITLITYSHQGAGTHIGITDYTLAITCEEKRTESCSLGSASSSPLASVIRL